jgi:NTE family protein
MTGVLTGLAEVGQDVTGADLIVGTSAGSAVAAQVGSGLSLEALFARQTDRALQSREIAVELDVAKMAAEFTRAHDRRNVSRGRAAAGRCLRADGGHGDRS